MYGVRLKIETGMFIDLVKHLLKSLISHTPTR